MHTSWRRLRQVRRRWWVIALVLVMAAAGGVWWTQRDTPAAAATTTNATVTRGDFSTTVTATGTIQPARQEDLSFADSGEVTKVLVAAGDRVRRGQVLARIDDDALVAQRDAADSALDAALTQLDEDQDADASDTQLAADEAGVAAVRSQLAQAQDAVDDAVLRAPMNGTVSAVNVAVGDQAGSLGGEATAAITVISTATFRVDASVGATDAATLKEGMQVQITPTGGAETVYGTVATIGRIATADSSGAATFPITIDVTGTPKGLYAGSSADVSIITRKVTDVLTVPTQALHTEGDETYVWVVDGTDRRRQVVETGVAYGPSTEVKSGLAEGDVVEVQIFTSPTGDGSGGNGGMVTFPDGGPPAGFDGGTGPQVNIEEGK